MTNILLVVLDTARADAFEPFGAPSGSSPAVADLARRGTAAVAHAASSWTVPSHAALFTGSLPRRLGLLSSPGDGPGEIARVVRAHRDRSLPEVARRAGFDTRAVSCNAWIAPRTGFDTGFDEFVTIRPRRVDTFAGTGPRRTARQLWHALAADQDDGAEEAADVLATWLAERDPDRPFLWFVNLMECHSPYQPPRPFHDRSALRRLRAIRDVANHQMMFPVWRQVLAELEVPADALDRMRSAYAGSVRAADAWVGRALESLDAYGILEDTMVVVTSDHGENLGEGGLIGHSFSLDERLVRVPLVVGGPVALPAGMARLVDLPWLLGSAVELSGAPWEPPVDHDVAVAQFEPLLEPDDPRVAEAIDEWHVTELGVRRLTEPQTSASDGRLKLVRHGDVEAVFDLATDPLEVRPLSAEEQRAFAARIDRLRAAVRANLEPDPAPVAVGPAAATAASPEEVAALETQMRMLGYL